MPQHPENVYVLNEMRNVEDDIRKEVNLPRYLLKLYKNLTVHMGRRQTIRSGKGASPSWLPNSEYGDMNMFVTINRIYIQTQATVFGVYLVFNRDTEGAKVKHKPRISRHSEKKRIFGIVGIIKLLLCRYLIVISKRSKVDDIHHRWHSMSDVWRVDKVNMIPLCPGKRKLTPEQRKQNEEYIFMVLSALNSRDFYYSNNYKLYSSLMAIHSANESDEADGFIWNSYLLTDLAKIEGAAHYCVRIINGYVGVQYFNCQSEEVVVALVSRRRNRRVGTRYFCRGIDTLGEVANFVETEVMLEWFNRKVSFLILRGTAPVQWDQWPDFSFYPNPVVLAAESQHLAFNRHFEWLKSRYGDQVLIDLCQYTPHGQQIHELCQEIASSEGYAHLRYHDLDIDNTVHSKVPHLPEEILKHVRDMGFTLTLNDVAISHQKGTFRISSIDCSDYTNVVQALLIKAIIRTLLQSVIGPDMYKPPKPEQLIKMEADLNELWLKQGDTLSLHYTGSRSLKSKLLQPVNSRYKRQSSWRIQLKRWFMNNFEDGFRQDSLDLILGTFRVNEKAQVTHQRSLTKLVSDYILPCIMTFASIQVLRFVLEYYDDYEHEDEGKCLLSWSVAVLVLWMWFYHHSACYVNEPTLVVKKPCH